MGALTQRRIGLKTAWRDLAERAARAESFAWIDAVTMLFKSGILQDREEALALLFQKVTADDLRSYRRVKAAEPLQ